jgi:hypothetical protein
MLFRIVNGNTYTHHLSVRKMMGLQQFKGFFFLKIAI